MSILNMKTYNVILKDSSYRELLVNQFEKVGNPEAIGTFVIVKTVKPLESITSLDYVLHAEEESYLRTEDVEWPITIPDPFKERVYQKTPHWSLKWIANLDDDSYTHTRDGEGVDIYVVDTGVDVSHPEFEGRAVTLYSFDKQDFTLESDHGTAVASCAAGKLCGAAKKATIQSCRVNLTLSDCIKSLDRVLLHHLNKEDDRPSILNMSLSSTSPLLGDALHMLAMRGVICVAAGGNSNSIANPVNEPSYPAKHPSVIEVGALDAFNSHDDNLIKPAWFSNRGCRYWAPGVEVQAASFYHDYTYIAGTSFASPLFAGVIACQQQFSSKMNNIMAANYAYYVHNLCESSRINWFPNGGTAPLTITLKLHDLDEPYYVAPSLRYSDEEIAQFCLQMVDFPDIIAQEALAQNVSLNRLVRCLTPHGVTRDDINQYFQKAGVKPFWVV